METNKNELFESMFKSLNSFTTDLQRELENLNEKLNEQIRLEENFDKIHDELQNDLIKIRASIETNIVKRSILERNLNERMSTSNAFHEEILKKRDEQKKLIDQSNLVKHNHHRTMAKIAEQCANLTLAFRTNFHAYARADLNEIRTKTDVRLKTIADEVERVENLAENDREKLKKFNEKIQFEIQNFLRLKETIDLISKKFQVESDEFVELSRLENEFVDLQTSIRDLDAWHRRTNYPSNDR